MLLKLIKINDFRIRYKSKKLRNYNYHKTLFIIKELIILMIKSNGIGISSNQICYFKKVIVVNVTSKFRPIIFINIDILKTNKFYTLGIEGCLSLPNVLVSVPRTDKIIVKFINIYNKKKIKYYNGIISRCVQHEVDHLKGILIIDYNKKNL